jgi:hypothetical protein
MVFKEIYGNSSKKNPPGRLQQGLTLCPSQYRHPATRQLETTLEQRTHVPFSTWSRMYSKGLFVASLPFGLEKLFGSGSRLGLL